MPRWMWVNSGPPPASSLRSWPLGHGHGGGEERYPSQQPTTGSGTLTRMAVVFRSLHPELHNAETDEVFDNGEWIPDALIRTEHLPKGFPTELFAPQRVNGSYAIRVDIKVAPGKLLLSRRHLRGHMDAGRPLSYVVFAKHGLPLSIPVYEPHRGWIAIPGRLCPLLEQKTSSK
jgi:hypothetical protein